MRKIRHTLVAAATAVSLTLTGTAVAGAQTDEAETASPLAALSSGGSSGLGHQQDAWDEDEDGNPIIRDEQQVTGENLLGDTTADDNPDWAENWRSLTTLGIVGSVLGAIIGGINWLKFQGILPA